MAVVVEAAGEAARGLLAAEVEEELGGGGEEDVMPGEDGLVGDVLGDHRLAEALRGDEDEVAGRGEEVEAERGLDGGAVDAVRPGPVEGVHRGEAAEAAAEEAPFEAAPGPVLLFVGRRGARAAGSGSSGAWWRGRRGRPGGRRCGAARGV